MNCANHPSDRTNRKKKRKLHTIKKPAREKNIQQHPEIEEEQQQQEKKKKKVNSSLVCEFTRKRETVNTPEDDFG